MERHTQATLQLELKLRTVITTLLHFTEVHMERQISEGTFGVVFKGSFRGNSVAIKRLKEVTASDKAMVEFVKEVAVLEKFRCYNIVHFFCACRNRNHVMMVTEYAPCGSLAECIKKRDGPTGSKRS